MRADASLQSDVSNAFLWVHRVYRDARALLTEVAEQLGRKGLRVWPSNKPDAQQAQDTAYMLVYCFFGGSEDSKDRAGDLFVAVSLYPDARWRRGTGPRLLAGTVKCSAGVDDWHVSLVNYAARAPGASELFLASPGDARLVECLPTELGKEKFRGVEVVRSFDVPVTALHTPEDVGEVVDAVMALRGNDDSLARGLIARWPD